MIEIKNTEVLGFEGAFRGMRNPLNSWKKADSDFAENIAIGENDMKLAKSLIGFGPADRKFLRMIHVQVDINAPLYWWKEFDTYKIATVADSCSTMHKIHSKDLTFEDISADHLTPDSIKVIATVLSEFNKNRRMYKETGDKEYWWQMIQLLPSSYNQMRTWDGNYETLISMYFQRRNHKLDEWHMFCDWILTLPYMKEFISVLDKDGSK